MTTIGFYHPHCAQGGGGERVLWKIIESLATSSLSDGSILDSSNPKCLKQIIIYTCDQMEKEKIFEEVERKFGIELQEGCGVDIDTVVVPGGDALINPISYPRLTMLRQMIGGQKFMSSAFRIAESAGYSFPDIFFDTTGCAWTHSVAKGSFFFGGKTKVFTYTHYPTISTDMLQMVYERRFSYNNSSEITGSKFKNFVKLLYYLLFALLYSFYGRLADVVMANSSWTANHVQKIWRPRGGVNVLWPPCNSKGFSEIDMNANGRENLILSIGQFRPEKDHSLQIKSFARLLKMKPKPPRDARLILLGGCRGEEDEERVEALKKLCKEMNVEKRVEFVLNQPFSVLKDYLARSSIGLHSMWNEHFGIGVVEMLAAGLVTIAHDSGGPKADIISPGETGFLASSEEEYASKMHDVLTSVNNDEIHQLRKAARKSSMQFDDGEFDGRFLKLFLRHTKEFNISS
ncbi:hypothetical protein TL16_g04499, partial [Triparma laevis f. inornata]